MGKKLKITSIDIYKSDIELKGDPVMGDVQYEAGKIDLPDTPGHGADIDPAFLKMCECTTVK